MKSYINCFYISTLSILLPCCKEVKSDKGTAIQTNQIDIPKKMNFPDTFLIKHDDYHAELIGKLPDGTQFFVTTPFRPKRDDDEGAEYLAVFLFEPNGKFREAKIDKLGTRSNMNKDAAQQLLKQRLSELEGASFCDITISHFSLEFDDTEFGFIPQPETGGIELHPGNFMAFFPPWDGFYDT